MSLLGHLSRPQRVALARNLLRFPALGIALAWAYLPLFQRGHGPYGPLITAGPGPWAGLIGTAGCAMGLLVYTLLPVLRRQAQRIVLGDVHFYMAALACMGLFFGLLRAGEGASLVVDPALVAHFSDYVTLRAVSGWLLCATALLPIVALLRPARSVPRAPAPPVDAHAPR